MTTEEKNKLIAEFMEFPTSTKEKNTVYGIDIESPLCLFWERYSTKSFSKDDNEDKIYYAFFAEELRFHSSWDWLMPVVEKIKRIPNKEKFGMLKYEVDVILDVPNAQIVQGYKRLLGDKSNKYFDVVCYENDFTTNVYNACVEFILWYFSSLGRRF